MFVQNWYEGAVELVLVFREGRHYVVEDDREVFDGLYEQCLDYVQRRLVGLAEEAY